LKKVLLDECVDWRLARSLTQFSVYTARQKGWSDLKNGTLLRKAAEEFEVVVSTDRGIEHQNNLKQIGIAVVILLPKRNKLSELTPLVPDLIKAIEKINKGEATCVPKN
jgi:predicted nuclease of predicted toxin-antitoxin system